MACEFFFRLLILYLLMAIKSLHAGISTMPPTSHAIPLSAFVDAVEEYKEDSATDSEGSMRDG